MVEARHREDQDRLAPNETPTDAYTVLNASFSYRFFTGNQVYDVILRGRNLTDEEVRNHTSFVKDIVPQPGRDVSVSVRLNFEAVAGGVAAVHRPLLGAASLFSDLRVMQLTVGGGARIALSNWYLGGIKEGILMITGAHFLLYSQNADLDRVFLQDVLGFRGVDVGGGWHILALPPSEIAVHPSSESFVQSHAAHQLLGAILSSCATTSLLQSSGFTTRVLRRRKSRRRIGG